METAPLLPELPADSEYREMAAQLPWLDWPQARLAPMPEDPLDLSVNDAPLIVVPPDLIPGPLQAALFALFMAVLLIFSAGPKRIRRRRFGR